MAGSMMAAGLLALLQAAASAPSPAPQAPPAASQASAPQDPSPAPAAPRDPAPDAAAPPVDASTVPGAPASTAVRLHEVDTRMTVPVLINGKGPYRFIVDSGATRTIISGALAALLGLPSAGAVSLHSIGGESRVPAVRIDSLYVGALPAKALVAPVLDAGNLGGLGILGIDTLKGKKMVIDLVRHSMTISPADAYAPRPGSNEIVVTARSRLGQLVLADADAAGQKIYAVVDTGSMVTLGNLTLRDKLVRHRRATPQPVTITDVTGRTIVASSAPIRDLRLGAAHLANVVLAFDDAHAFERFGLAKKPAMLLGMDIMQAFSRVSIDFARRTVRLTRPEEKDAAPIVRLNPEG
ncbi:retropepsin-like aspartic protease [Sphingomonas morindae]|uniref:Aspartyl protease family protein n=1 Tax=Sphingomonas morindae TaxID=1541170 RepID=A0ABY4X9Z3_9SPHN|nr:retropepsin-like aspartic protease [Sphingomonas morindae]USI73762.1 aspartyl protease family protein [Sphingomonas morindae]